MREGRLVAEVSRQEASEDVLMKHMAGVGAVGAS
jgi:hypothetical protein